MPGLVDDQVRQVAGVRPVRVLQAVLMSERVVVATGAREGGCDARPDGMDMDPVQPRREALDLDVHVYDAACVLRQVERPDRRTRGIDERPVRVTGSFRAGR